MDFLIPKAYAYVADTASNNTSAFDTLLSKILSNVVTPIIYLLFALAVVYFLLGMIKFLQNVDNVQKRAEGQQNMIWGVVGIFIMVSAKGIINVILSTLGL